jgi:hypothetical protein
MFCGLNEIAAAIDMTITPASKLSIQQVLDDIAKLDGQHGVTLEMTGASFGLTDLSVYVKTSLKPTRGVHPTWRIAQFVEDLRNHPNIATATSRILIHDPHHDQRMHAARKPRGAAKSAKE